MWTLRKAVHCSILFTYLEISENRTTIFTPPTSVLWSVVTPTPPGSPDLLVERALSSHERVPASHCRSVDHLRTPLRRTEYVSLWKCPFPLESLLKELRFLHFSNPVPVFQSIITSDVTSQDWPKWYTRREVHHDKDWSKVQFTPRKPLRFRNGTRRATCQCRKTSRPRCRPVSVGHPVLSTTLRT